MHIKNVVEGARGCGYRTKGLYLMAEGNFIACYKLPLPLDICPTCGGGIKYSRGWTWIKPDNLFEPGPCVGHGPSMGDNCHPDCLLHHPPIKAGLLWIGKQHYANPIEWTKEAITMGVSRKIKFVPKGFKVGETVVCVAHIRACLDTNEWVNPSDIINKPGIFQAFVPQRIEYVVDGSETTDELEAYDKRDIELVRVTRQPEPEQQEIPNNGGV